MGHKKEVSSHPCLPVSTSILRIFVCLLDYLFIFVSACNSYPFLDFSLPQSFHHVPFMFHPSLVSCLSHSILPSCSLFFTSPDLSDMSSFLPQLLLWSWRSSSGGTNASSGQCEANKTTQLLHSPELIYAAVSKAPSLWHCHRRNQHRLLPSLHASLAVVGNPFRWSLTTRFCIS